MILITAITIKGDLNEKQKQMGDGFTKYHRFV